MKTIALIFTVLLAGCNLAIAQSPYATRLPAELQTAQMDSLADLTWLQGTTPAIRVEPLLRGRPVAVDADTTVRMVIGPSATGTLYAARTNLAAVTNAYEIQWPTIGTNSAGEAWFYTLLFDRAGYTYWSGSGSLYIEETTSTASNGLAWIEYTTPNVGWENVVGDPADNSALVQYVEDHGGGSAVDTIARAGVVSNAADIATLEETVGGITAESLGALTEEADAAALAAVAGVQSNLTAHAADTDNPHGVTAGQLGALTNIVVESVGGPLLEDFATAEFRVSGSGWGVAATGEAVNHDNVIARENTLGLRENFTVAFTNIRSSVEGGVPTTTAGANLSDGPFSAGTWDMAGNTATGLHWSAGVQSGAVGVVEFAIGSWTGQASRTFPGYTATTNVHEFLGFVPGSLRAAVDADMLARNATGLINPYETTTTWPNLVRNTNVWTKDMDLTCVSPYSSLGSWTYNFTLVTPQHVVFASHWPSTGTNSSLIDGHTLYFVDSTNGLHSREVVKARQVWLDCSVGLLDAPLPAAVTPAKIIDTNDFAKFKGVETLRPAGSLVGPSGMIGVHVRPTYARAVRVPFDPPTPDSNTYWWSSRDPNLRHSDTHSGTNYVGGESGSPVLLCIEGQTVIAQTIYTGGGAGPHIAALRPQIEATMATLGESAHTNLETINLAHWPDYP